MKKIGLLSLLLLIVLALTACTAPVAPAEAPDAGEAETEGAAEPAEEMADGTVLSLWYHGAGNEVESALLMNIINDFNASQGEYVVEVQDFPQASYNESIVAAALANDLPDIIDMDGPVMPNWAWSGYLSPLSLS